MRLTVHFSENVTYNTYVRMQPAGFRGLMVGDVYIFEGDRIIGVIAGLKFQAIKRLPLGSLLPSQNADNFPKRSFSHHTHPRVPTAIQTTTDRVNQQALYDQVVNILASEVGVDSSELCEDANLHVWGVDSILSISALGRLRQITQIDLPSSLFTTYTTIGELKSVLGFDGPVQKFPENNLTENSHSGLENSSYSSSQIECNSSTTPVNIVETFRATVAEEAGIDVTEIHMDTEFSDLGVNSILGLSIINVFVEKTNMKLPVLLCVRASDIPGCLGIFAALMSHRTQQTAAANHM